MATKRFSARIIAHYLDFDDAGAEMFSGERLHAIGDPIVKCSNHFAVDEGGRRERDRRLFADADETDRRWRTTRPLLERRLRDNDGIDVF